MTTDSTWDSRDRLRAFGHRGDVAVGISTSGQSPNVLRAMSTVKKMGAADSWVGGRDWGTLGRCPRLLHLRVVDRDPAHSRMSHVDRAHHLGIGRADDIS